MKIRTPNVLAFAHGDWNNVYADSAGTRGDTDLFSASMFTATGERKAGREHWARVPCCLLTPC